MKFISLKNDEENVLVGVSNFRKWLHRLYARIRRFIIYGVIILLTFSALWLLFVFVERLDQYEALQEEKTELQNSLLYWEQVTKTHKDAPDAYYQAAVYAYTLNDAEKTKAYLERALYLDPSFKEAEDLQQEIQNE